VVVGGEDVEFMPVAVVDELLLIANVVGNRDDFVDSAGPHEEFGGPKVVGDTSGIVVALTLKYLFLDGVVPRRATMEKPFSKRSGYCDVY
jgi:hypothetical protein